MSTALLTPEQLTDARDWVADCVWADLDADDVTELTDVQVTRGIARHYDGGVAQFIADSEPYATCPCGCGVIVELDHCAG